MDGDREQVSANLDREGGRPGGQRQSPHLPVMAARAEREEQIGWQRSVPFTSRATPGEGLCVCRALREASLTRGPFLLSDFRKGSEKPPEPLGLVILFSNTCRSCHGNRIRALYCPGLISFSQAANCGASGCGSRRALPGKGNGWVRSALLVPEEGTWRCPGPRDRGPRESVPWLRAPTLWDDLAERGAPARWSSALGWHSCYSSRPAFPTGVRAHPQPWILKTIERGKCCYPHFPDEATEVRDRVTVHRSSKGGDGNYFHPDPCLCSPALPLPQLSSPCWLIQVALISRGKKMGLMKLSVKYLDIYHHPSVVACSTQCLVGTIITQGGGLWAVMTWSHKQTQVRGAHCEDAWSRCWPLLGTRGGAAPDRGEGGFVEKAASA